MMKKLVCLMIASTVFLVSFTKDTMTDENLVQPGSKVPVPMKGIICMSQNNDFRLPVSGTPVMDATGKEIVPAISMSGFATLAGHATHMGTFKAQSSMTGISASLDMGALAQGRVVLVAFYTARLTGANGDFVDLVSPIRIDVTDQSHRVITGTFTITGGSGRFENASGGGVINGVLPCWDVDGQIQY